MIDGLGDRRAEGELSENVERKVISFTVDEKMTDEKEQEGLEVGVERLRTKQGKEALVGNVLLG